jgi:hypothetical protein
MAPLLFVALDKKVQVQHEGMGVCTTQVKDYSTWNLSARKFRFKQKVVYLMDVHET